MIQVGFILLLWIEVVTAAAPAPPAPANPPCVLTCKLAENFELGKFAITWYEVRKIASTPGREGTCRTATYTVNGDKTLNVDLVWVDSAGKPQTLSGKVKPSGIKFTDAYLTVTFGENSALYTIFYLNYGTMFGVYTCIDSKAYVWVFAKTKEVADGDLKDLNTAMTDSGLDPKLLKPTLRTGCPAA